MQASGMQPQLNKMPQSKVHACILVYMQVMQARAHFHTWNHTRNSDNFRPACTTEPLVCWIVLIFNYQRRKLAQTQTPRATQREIKCFPKFFRGLCSFILYFLSRLYSAFLRRELWGLSHFFNLPHALNWEKCTYIFSSAPLATASNCWKLLLYVVSVWKRVMMPSVETVPSGTEQMHESD